MTPHAVEEMFSFQRDAHRCAGELIRERHLGKYEQAGGFFSERTPPRQEAMQNLRGSDTRSSQKMHPLRQLPRLAPANNISR